MEHNLHKSPLCAWHKPEADVYKLIVQFSFFKRDGNHTVLKNWKTNEDHENESDPSTMVTICTAAVAEAETETKVWWVHVGPCRG